MKTVIVYRQWQRMEDLATQLGSQSSKRESIQCERKRHLLLMVHYWSLLLFSRTKSIWFVCFIVLTSLFVLFSSIPWYFTFLWKKSNINKYSNCVYNLNFITRQDKQLHNLWIFIIPRLYRGFNWNVVIGVWRGPRVIKEFYTGCKGIHTSPTCCFLWEALQRNSSSRICVSVCTAVKVHSKVIRTIFLLWI